jgi:hypothetical protein
MSTLRHDWSRDDIRALFDLPFMDLLFRAQTVHRANFDANAIQVSTSTLLAIKKTVLVPRTANMVRRPVITTPAWIQKNLDTEKLLSCITAVVVADAGYYS